MKLTAGVNFINILRTRFLYKHLFLAAFSSYIYAEKAAEGRLYKKCAQIALMKSMAVDFLNTFFKLNINVYTYCWAYCYATYFWIGYATYGGFGMALVRFLNK